MSAAGVDIVKLTSGFTAALLGLDVNVAAQAGANAATNNQLSDVLTKLKGQFVEHVRATIEAGGECDLTGDVGDRPCDVLADDRRRR